jgi:hypothetical protein
LRLFDPRIGSAAPEGVFYNRMSASSRARGHRYAAELTAANAPPRSFRASG